MHRSHSLKTAALVSLTAAATTFLIQACGGSAEAQALNGGDAIEGVWDSTVTNKDCASGAVVATPFKALVVFRRGGTLDVDNSQHRATRGNIYGTWTRGAGAAYAANVVHQRFNPDQTYAGLNKIQRSVTLATDESTFTSTLAIQVLDAGGAVVQRLCATESAVRLNL